MISDHESYIDYSDLMLLASIEVPRIITDPDDLHNLHLLGSQDLTNWGSTMRIASQEPGDFFSVPTASLTDYGRVVLRYMRSIMTWKERWKLTQEAKQKHIDCEAILKECST